MKRLILLLLVALATSGCAQVLTSGAAVVNGSRISQAQVDSEVKAQLSGGQSATPQTADSKLQITRQVLARLILNQLQLEAAARKHITADEAKVSEQYNNIRNSGQFTSEADFVKKLSAFGLTPETFRKRIREGLILDKLLAGLAGTVTDAQVARVYRLQQDQYRQARIKRILIAINAKRPDVIAHATALDVVNQLKGGASFAALAKKYSDDTTSKPAGGEYKTFLDLANISDPTFSEAIWNGKVGAVNGPLKSQFGWEVFVVTAKRIQPLAEVRAQIVQQLQQQANQAAQGAFLRTAVKGADVIVNPRYGDWDPQTGSIVAHQAIVAPENSTDENAPILGGAAPAVPPGLTGTTPTGQ